MLPHEVNASWILYECINFHTVTSALHFGCQRLWCPAGFQPLALEISFFFFLWNFFLWAITNNVLTWLAVSFQLLFLLVNMCSVPCLCVCVLSLRLKCFDWQAEQHSPVQWSQRQQVSTELWPVCFPSSSSYSTCSGACVSKGISNAPLKYSLRIFFVTCDIWCDK